MIKFTILLSLVCLTIAQENAQSRIPRSLEECYRNRDIYQRDNRLPMTISTLIELIKKVEDTPGLNMDMREVALSFVHRFKQDGIEKAKNIDPSPLIIPYSPVGFQFYKHRILLSKLLPGNAVRFPNETLTMEEHCTLHFMLSTSIDTEIRGDESMRCSSLAQYRTNRIPRGVDDDVEMVFDVKSEKKKGALVAMKDKEDDYYDDDDVKPISGRSDVFGVEVDENMVSQCPIENGVLRSKWGAVNAGTLLSGIAAGLIPQQVRSSDLMPRMRANNKAGRRVARQAQRIIDNRWASTLAGDLSEVALRQGPNKAKQIQVGAKGAWNSTTLPRWYFLSQRDRFEMTDAEIRGGLDGMIIGMKIKQWSDSVSQLRLSQILDMYYSQRGVFSGEEKACKRKDLFEEVAPRNDLKQQTAAFSSILDNDVSFVTLNDEAFDQFSSNAVDALYNYIPQSLSDPSCDATRRDVNDDSSLRALTDLFIFVDTQYDFQSIQPVIGDILQNIDLGYGSNYTILTASQGDVLVNSSTSTASFLQWNQTVHDLYPKGLNLPKVLEKLRELAGNTLNWEKSTSNMGGRSKLALIVVQMSGVSDAERQTALDQLEILRDVVPDLRIMFLANGSPSRFEQFVKDKKDDLFQLNINSGVGTEIQTQTLPVYTRIQKLPRRLVNHRCGAEWNGDHGNNNLNQFIEPNGVIYYRLAPNYYYRKNDARKIKIQNMGYASLAVCHSRTVEFPRQNSTTNQGEVTCRNINTDTVEIPLPNPCDGQYYIHTCDPIYVSVEYHQSAPTSNFRCNELSCRTPDSAKFVIHGEQLGCYSGVGQVLASISLVLLSIYTSLRLY